MKKILIVGQTPPPFGGQAVMIEHLVNCKYPNIRLYHVRMNFSRGMKDMGKFQLYKVWHLLCVIIKIYYIRLIKQANILYYPPSGPNSAVYRDMMILFPTRWMFKKTIFHFHASGLSQHIGKRGLFFDIIFRRCFFYPDIAIQLSESCPDEGTAIHAKKTVIIPNGLPDEAGSPNILDSKPEINILFIGLLEESKGELDLCRAVIELKSKGINVKARIAGEFKTQEYQKDFNKFVDENNIQHEVEYLGVIRGQEKESAFRKTDVFCFPSFFHSESFPLVLIEAMSYGIPIVSTRWRGIVDMVTDGDNGYLVEINNPHQVAVKIEEISSNVELRKRMGQSARKYFEDRYDMRQHLRLMENVFKSI